MARKKAAKKSAAGAASAIKVVAYNRKVRHQYEVIKSYEAGLVLQGSEVKSIRGGDVQWADAHARYDERKQELWLWGLYIGEYRYACHTNHLPTAPRKLLLHQREIAQIANQLQTKGTTVVPRQIHFRKGFAKVDICVVRGKKLHDKRQDMIRQTLNREAQREVRDRLR